MRNEPFTTAPRRAGLLVAGSLALFLLPVASFGIEVEVEAGRVSIDATNVPLDELVETLAREGGLRLVRREPLRRSVSVDIDSRPLADVLDELLKTQSYLLFLPVESAAKPRQPNDEPGIPATLWIFPEHSGDAASALLFFENILIQGQAGEKKAAIRELRRLGTAEAVQSLSLALGDNDERIRNAAIEALTKIGGDEALAVLASAASAAAPGMRADAAEAIAMAGGPSARAYLELALGDDDPRVRAAAVESLGDLGDGGAQDIIRSALSDPDAEVRRRAVEILEDLNDEAMFRALFPAD